MRSDIQKSISYLYAKHGKAVEHGCDTTTHLNSLNGIVLNMLNAAKRSLRVIHRFKSRLLKHKKQKRSVDQLKID